MHFTFERFEKKLEFFDVRLSCDNNHTSITMHTGAIKSKGKYLGRQTTNSADLNKNNKVSFCPTVHQYFAIQQLFCLLYMYIH